ncbi:MAG: LysR substrate-binding domain-containing protein [Tagaea sp.]|nr:LysR substrate-binding domain-containing protein [Tagaea sp.]
MVAFDAVVRHRSFTRAAGELGLTQSAVSHQVRRLEEFCGTKLLRRLNPGVELNGAGAKLQSELAPLLDGLAALAAGLRPRPGRRTLRFGASSSLASWWLVRRLRAFRALHPDIELDFVPVESDAPSGKSLDIRISWTSLAEARATSLQAPLFRERIIPVCAPSVLPGGKPLADPAALLHLPLIQKGSAPSGEWSWAFWLKKLGVKRAEPRDLVLGDVGLCLTAAVEGAGIAIGRSLLVADAIGDGRLVPALAPVPVVASSKVHIARWSPDLVGDRDTRILVAWLARAAEETIAEVEKH